MGPFNDGEGFWAGLLGEFGGRLGLELWEFWSWLRRGFADGTGVAGSRHQRGERQEEKENIPHWLKTL